MNRTGLLLMLALFFSASSMAKTFINEDYGYTIEVDDSYQLTRNDDVTYFSDETGKRLIAIKNWPGLTEEAARDYIQHGYQDENVAIVASGDAEELTLEKGKGLLVDVQGVVERKLIKGITGGFVGDDGQGLIVLFSGPAAEWGKLAAMAKQATTSIRFVAYDAGMSAIDWFHMLAGTRLSLRGTSSDNSRREDLYFCSDGSFKHRVQRSSSQQFDTGSAFGFAAKSKSGLWTVVDKDGTSRIMLRYSDGREESALLEDRNGRTFLDGQRYYMMPNHRCR
ncbi:MAG: hypothetical protein PVF35_01670 [Gammaproteobacteria bacterium]|jgi:hypothetical protein